MLCFSSGVQNNRRSRAYHNEPPPVLNCTAPTEGTSESSRPMQCTVKVYGLPPDASEDLVTNFFENAKRSKGGPVSAVVMEPDFQKCLVTFESPDGKCRFIGFTRPVKPSIMHTFVYSSTTTNLEELISKSLSLNALNREFKGLHTNSCFVSWLQPES